MNANNDNSDDDSYSPGRYSDDFDSEDSKGRQFQKKTSTPRKVANHRYYQEKFQGRGRGNRNLKPRQGGLLMKKGRGNSRTSEPANMRKSYDNVTSRVLSASRNRINELRNRVEELNMQVRELQQENKLYKRTQFRQEKVIRVLEDQESDLPSILDRHSNEVRALKEQNKRLKEKFDKTDRYLRDAEDELERVKKKMNKYREMCEEKDLKDRDELSRKLAQAELDLAEKESKLKELQRHIEMLKKNHRHEMATEAARQKEMKKQLEDLLEKNSQLDNQLKEKERALNYLNIYSNPQQGRPSRDNSPNSSVNAKSTRRLSGISELTPREKAKFYAEKRRVELLKKKRLKEEKEVKKREQWEREERERHKNASLNESAYGNKNREIAEREEKNRLDNERRHRLEMENTEREEEELQKKQTEEYKRQEQEYMDRMRRESREKREREEREKREKEEREKKERRQREEAERREQEEREREFREERERKEHEIREERERIEQEMREEKERKQKLEKERKAKEMAEQEKRLLLEREKLINDPLVRAERKKKDDLLKKLQTLDKKKKSVTSHYSPPSPQKKNKELSRTSEIADALVFQNGNSERKEYSFSKPINNLHQGKPSHEDITVPYIERQKRRQPNDGYQPSFGSPERQIPNVKTTPTLDSEEKPIFKLTNNAPAETSVKSDAKSANLLETLFGSQSKTQRSASMKQFKEENDDIFFSTNPSPSNKQMATNSTTFPWDGNTASSTTQNRLNSDKKPATIFGTGSLFEDDFTENGSKVLPRRPKQQNLNTFSVKPSVTAIDAVEDEIEEFVL